jgi:hypothetical protein
MTLRTLGPAAVAAAVALAGCDASPRVAPVSGRVTLNGQPLAAARVAFQPVGTGSGGLAPGPGSVGTTDADGRYTLALIGANRPGAVVGHHRVVVSKTDVPADPAAASDEKPGAKSPKELLPKRYNDDTELTCDVPAGGNPDANFDLKSP